MMDAAAAAGAGAPVAKVIQQPANNAMWLARQHITTSERKTQLLEF